MKTLVRAALLIGFAIDAYVGALGLFAPQLITPLLDIPLRDPLFARVAGGEYVVVALVYALAIRYLERFRPLLLLCALDQVFGVVIPGLAVLNGNLPATWKIVAPIPLQALLALLFCFYALRPASKRSATPFMQ